VFPPRKIDGGETDLPLQRADLEPREDLARLVAVADVLEGFGCVLAGEVEEDLLAAAGLRVSFRTFWLGAERRRGDARVLVDEAAGVVHVVVDDDVQVLLGVVGGHLGVGEEGRHCCGSGGEAMSVARDELVGGLSVDERGCG